MAKYERDFQGDFNELLNILDSGMGYAVLSVFTKDTV